MVHLQLRVEEEKMFPQVVSPRYLAKRSKLTEFNGVSKLVMLDRYSLRDDSLVTLKEGDLVVTEVKYDPKYPTQGYGHVTKIEGNKVTVKIDFPEYVEGDDGKPIDLENFVTVREKIIKPLEIYWEQICYRTAKGAASVEKSRKLRRYWFRKFFWMLANKLVIPGGRVLYGAGSGIGVTLYNCFVLDFIQDSRKGISRHRETVMEIMSRGGGVGSNGSALRPKNAPVHGVRGKSSGSVSWLDDLSRLTDLVQQGGCVAPYERVMTDKGVLTVKEIFESQEDIYALTHKGFKKITAKFDNGSKKVFKVVTEHGYSLDASEDHKFGVYDEKGNLKLVPLKDLKEGDNLVLLLGENFVKDYVHLDTTLNERSKFATTTLDVKLPSVLDEKLAYILGLYHSNGSNIKNEFGNKGLTISIAEDRPLELENVVKYLKELFGVEPTIKQGGGKVKVVSVYSVVLMEFLEKNGLIKDYSHNVKVPESIFISPKEVVKAYLGGLFAGDGSNKGTKGGLSLTTTSKDLAEQYKLLLLSIGIASNTHVEIRKEKWLPLYKVNVSGAYFSNKFADYLDGWTTKINDKDLSTKDSSFSLPFNLYDRFKYIPEVKKSIGSNAKRTSMRAITNLVRNYSLIKEEDKDLADLVSSTVSSKVAKIEYVGEMNVYDFEVEDVHMLSFNGFYTSNSRRGAQMIALADWHPDIVHFILCKIQNPYVLDKIVKEVDNDLIRHTAESLLVRDKDEKPAGVKDPNFMTGANISVLISHDFMRAVEADGDWHLRFPDIQNLTPEQKEFYDKEWSKMGDVRKWEAKGLPVKTYYTIKARAMWDLINIAARYSAEPGIIFIDHCNDMSNSYYYASLVVTNPCGEQPLPPYGVCNLLAINMAEMVDRKTKQIKWGLLKKVTHISQRFADNIIDHSIYFLEENERMAKGERRVGKGVMGLADFFINLEIPYGSEEMLKITDEVFNFIKEESYLASANLAEEKGSFPFFDKEKYLESGFVKTLSPRVREAIAQKGIRNVCSLTVAPTGSTGTMIGVSTGLEPYYSFKYYRSGRLGKWIEVNTEIAQRYFDEHPEATSLPHYYVGAMDIGPLQHVKVQAVIQKHVDSAISKTCNAPRDFTVEQNKELYFAAWKSGCKGVTVYVDGSRDTQVLSLEAKDNEFTEESVENLEVVNQEKDKERLVGVAQKVNVEPRMKMVDLESEVTDDMLTHSTKVCKISFDNLGNMITECN